MGPQATVRQLFTASLTLSFYRRKKVSQNKSTYKTAAPNLASLLSPAGRPASFWQNGFMATTPKLTDAQVQTALQDLPGWTVLDAKLHRDYQFADFAHAIGFIATAAIGIEKRNHHPEWFNVYNRVRVDLTTHDSGGITQKDVDLAQMLENIAKRLV
jgi:4a-hydroxytetrahydrobiopterin dehydratase